MGTTARARQASGLIPSRLLVVMPMLSKHADHKPCQLFPLSHCHLLTLPPPSLVPGSEVGWKNEGISEWFPCEMSSSRIARFCCSGSCILQVSIVTRESLGIKQPWHQAVHQTGLDPTPCEQCTVRFVTRDQVSGERFPFL